MGGPEFADAAQVADPGLPPGDEVVMFCPASLLETVFSLR